MAAESFLKELHPAGLSSWEGRRTSVSRASVNHILTISVSPQLNLLFALSDLFLSASLLNSLFQGYCIWDIKVCLLHYFYFLKGFFVIETLIHILYIWGPNFFPDGSAVLLPKNISAWFIPWSNANLTLIVFPLFFCNDSFSWEGSDVYCILS